MNYNVMVIGGGAAGMLAASTAAGRGLSVLLLEKNEKLGKKIYITGKGRCNVTNACDFETFIDSQFSNKKFLYSAFRAFDNEAMCELLESAGCRLKTERGNRVFPVSDHASDITKALSKLLDESGVEVRLNTELRELVKTEAKDGELFKARTFDKAKKRIEEFTADKVIVATGGLSYPTTGSTGDGYKLAKSFGLNVTNLMPSLVPIELTETEECTELSGLSLKNAELSIFEVQGAEKKKELYREFGELLFTHKGISGPLVLTATGALGRELSDKSKTFTALIDLKPAISFEQLDQRLIREFDAAKNKEIKTVLPLLLPRSLSELVIRRAGIDPSLKVNSVTKLERHRLTSLMKALDFEISGLGGFNEAVVTKGGVEVSEINPKTMEAKKVKGLYFAGEILDIDAKTGGFNLQNCWSSAHAAGMAV